MQRAVRATEVVAFLLSIAVTLFAFGAANRVWFVPWKVLEHGMEPDPALFTLYWIPASPEELKRSDLVTSRTLAVYSGRCVAMHVIRVDDQERLGRFRADELPIALLAEGEQELARVSGQGTPLRVAEVEAMVRSEFNARAALSEEELDEARKRLRRGDRPAAAAIYRRVALRRCAFPRQAREAQRALNRMR